MEMAARHGVRSENAAATAIGTLVAECFVTGVEWERHRQFEEQMGQ